MLPTSTTVPSPSSRPPTPLARAEVVGRGWTVPLTGLDSLGATVAWPDTVLPPPPGEALALAVPTRFGPQTARARVAAVDEDPAAGPFVTLRWASPAEPRPSGDARRSPRWRTGDAAPILSVPGLLDGGHTARLVVRDLAAGGLGVEVAGADPGLVPGLELVARLHLPTVTDVDVGIRVVSGRATRCAGRPVIRAGVALAEDASLPGALGAWLARFGPAAGPVVLRRAGLVDPPPRSALAFGPAGDPGEVDAWLGLAAPLAVTARHHGRLVGAAGLRLDGALARLDAFLLDPDYRTDEVAVELWHEAVRVAWTGGARGVDVEACAAALPFLEEPERGVVDLARWLYGGTPSSRRWRASARAVRERLAAEGSPVPAGAGLRLRAWLFAPRG